MSNYHAPYFPARSLLKQSSDGGAWLVAYKEEQKKRFNAVLCPLTKEEQWDIPHKSSRTSKFVKSQSIKISKILDGVFLLNHMNVNYPSDLAYINIIGESLNTSKAEDFVLFDNVVHIEAGENNLTLDTFKTFPVLCELELQLNGISSLNLTSSDFKHLERLDLSFNSLTPSEVRCLGTLLSLKCLHLTGNGLQLFPTDFGNKRKSGSMTPKSESQERFQSLEVLYIDENDFEDISVFASLASLPRLKVLNLARNRLQSVPQLRLMALNMKKTHVLPTAGYVDEKGDSDVQDATVTNYDASSARDTDPKAVIQEEDGDNNDDSNRIALHPSLETPENELRENLDKNSAKPELERLEHGLASENVSFGDFQFEEHEEGRDTTFNVSGREQVTDYGTAEFSPGSVEVDLDLCLDELECPFANLEKIDLTYNLIADDDALLPLATWPSLVEVNIWKNPLVKNRKGISPVLQYHLTNLCGIRINRKEPGKTCKPAVGPTIAPVARYNKVKDVMPPLRKKNMLLLEFEKYEAFLGNNSPNGPPLPAISSANESAVRPSHSAPARPINSLTVERAGHRSQSAAPDYLGGQKFKERSNGPDIDSSKNGFRFEDDKNGVFLTQVDINDDGPQSPASSDKDDMDLAKYEAVDAKSISRMEEEGKCSGTIEDLLKTDESIESHDIPSEDNVHANIKALKFALNNSLVFNESSQQSFKEPKHLRPQQRNKVISSRRARQDQVYNALDGMRKQNNIVEESLDVVLRNYDQDKHLKHQFPHVKRLLKEVQSKYDQVRLTSLDSACNAHKVLQSTIGKPQESRNFQERASFLQRKGEAKETKVVKSRGIINDTKIDPLDNVSRKLEKLKEAVNSRI